MLLCDLQKKDADEKDELDALVQGKAKSLKDRLGNSPEAIEKKMKKRSTGKANTSQEAKRRLTRLRF